MSRVLTLLAALLLVPALAGCTTIAPSVSGGKLSITMATEPVAPMAGGATTMVFSVSQDGQPLTGARVLVVRRLIGVVHPDDDIVFESVEQGDGRYSAATSFAAPGRWDVQVIVTPTAGEAEAAAFEVSVTQP